MFKHYQLITQFLSLFPLLVLTLLAFLSYSNGPIKKKNLTVSFLVTPTCGMIVGISLQQYIKLHPLLLASIIFCAGLVFWRGRSFLLHACKPTSLFCMFFIIGAFLLGAHTVSQRHLAQFLHDKKMTLEGTITNVESEKMMHVHVENVRFTKDKTRRSCSFALACTIYGKKKLNRGDKVQLKRIRLSKLNTDFQRYLSRHGLIGAIHISQNNLKLNGKSKPNHISVYRNKLFASLKRKMNPATLNLFASLFLGHKKAKKENTSKHFFDFWGISHFLARSGLHIIIFILLWQFLLQFVPLPFFLKQLLLLALCTIYHLLSWPSISFIRAYALFTLYLIGSLANRPTHLLHLLTLITLTTLLYNPFHLFFLDFQLSFTLAYGLSLFFGYVKKSRNIEMDQADMQH